VSGESGTDSTELEEENESTQTSKNSDAPTSGSNKRWRAPRTVKEFAAQVNQVATMVLNQEIDEDVAKLYASNARVVAQAISSEVTRARFVREEPNLSLEADTFEDDGATGDGEGD
jgi:hypothetical protein